VATALLLDMREYVFNQLARGIGLIESNMVSNGIVVML